MHSIVLAMALGVVGPRAGFRFIHVGQGSALLVVGSRHVALVDSGPSAGAEAVLRALDEHDVHHLDLWIHTHYDADHIGAAPRVKAGMDGTPATEDDVTFASVWDRGRDNPPGTVTYQAYAEAFGDQRRTVRAGDVADFGDWVVEVLPHGVIDGAPENHRALALCIDLGPIRLLAPSDLPAAAVMEALTKCPGPDVLWASHHGSRDGTSWALVDTADPTIVVVSAGRDNPYCHPHRETLARWWAHTVWITDVASPGGAGPCPPPSLGPDHHVAASDLWLPTAR